MSPGMAATTKQYSRIKYPGVPIEGACFVRALVRQNDVIVLAAQLQNYGGPSVTNSWEAIRPIVIKKLQTDVGLDHLAKAKPWWKFWDRSGATYAEIMAKTRWLEYYPPSTGLRPEGSIAEVIMIGHIEWVHTNQENLTRLYGIPSSFFTFQEKPHSILDFKIPPP